MFRKKAYWLFLSYLIFALALTACGGSSDTTDTTSTGDSDTTANTADTADTAADTAESDDVIKVDIFVGLGTGTDPDQVTEQEVLAEKFNSTHDDIEIEFVIVPNDESTERLLAQISGGNPPGLVGPGGVDVAANYFDLWLDVQPYIDAENFDTSDFYGAAVTLYEYPEKTVGLPLGMFPSFIFYNKDHFDAAGLDYPTTDYNDTSWTYDALRDVAMQLTLDANGNNALSPDFDANNIVQWGFDDSWTDMRGFMTRFDPPGAGRPTDEAMLTAQINSDEYKYGLNWLNNAIWVDHFMADYAGQDAFYAVAGDPFGSGLTSMFYSHTWFMPEGLVDLPFEYGFAAAPFNQKGTRVSRIHADTFYIPKDFPHPEASWEVLKWLTAPEQIVDVCLVYGCLPSRQSVQEEYTAQMESRYGADNEYDVLYNAIAFLDNPHHESWLPNVVRVNDILQADVYDVVFTSQIEDTDALLDSKNAEIQGLIDSYWAEQ